VWSVVLAALAAELALLVVLLAAAVVINRVFLGRDARAGRAGRAAAPTLHAWTAEGSLELVAAALRALPPADARAQLAVLTTTRLPAASAAALGALVRGEPWARAALAGARSRRWTRRLEAARLLPALGGDEDAPLLDRLLADPHLPVRAAATAALPRLADPATVARVVRALPAQPEALRRLQAHTLRARWQTAEAALVGCLTRASDAAPPAVAAWVSTAAILATPGAVAACVPLHRHEAGAVRVEVARALGAALSPAALAALVALLDDPVAEVRAAAAGAVAGYGAAALPVLPRLTALLSDRVWAVRCRAAIALALLGEPGRHALRAARSASDRFARDMAALVAGLPEGTVIEMADA
jgi:HEAT repeat protein